MLNATRKQQQELHSGKERIATPSPPVPILNATGDSSRSLKNGSTSHNDQQDGSPVRTADPVSLHT